MHKSIFKKVEDYKSNPLDEYIKLNSFYFDSNKEAYYNFGKHSIYDLLSESFIYCEKLTGVYKDLNNCFNNEIKYLRNLAYSRSWDSLTDDEKETVLDEFQTFAEIVSYIYIYGIPKFVANNKSLTINNSVYKQGFQLLETSLKSFNYEINVLNEEKIVEINKIHPVAEKVALQSTPEIKKTIVSYLGAHNKDINSKRQCLHDLIDLLEPKLKKYESQDKIGLIKNYCQIMRHPEIKGKQEQYQWFMNDLDKNLDEVFELCIYVLQYDIANATLKQFAENTRNGLKNKQ